MSPRPRSFRTLVLWSLAWSLANGHSQPQQLRGARYAVQRQGASRGLSGRIRLAAHVEPARSLPAWRAICNAALPLLAACLCEPGLTLIDTACVGNLGTQRAVGLAALSVNGAVFDLISNVLATLCTASTNVVASAKGRAASARALNVALMVGIFIGVVGASCLFGLAPWIVANVFGLAGSPDVASKALAYMRIRSLGVPIVCTNYVLYGAVLASGNTSIAAPAVACSAAVNVALDLILVGALQWSTAGAAVATVASTGTACAILWRQIMGPVSAMPSQDEDGRKGGRRFRIRDMQAALPTRAELRPFGAISGAVLLGTTTTSAIHAVATRVVSAASSVVASATHQVAFQTVGLLSCTSIPLSLAVQGLLGSHKEDKAQVRSLVRSVILLSSLSGLLAAGCARVALVEAARFLTADMNVAECLRGRWPIFASTTFAWCQTTALFGVFVGLGLLGPFICVHAAAALGTLAYISLGAGRVADPLLRAWFGSLLYSCTRLALYGPSLIRQIC